MRLLNTDTKRLKSFNGDTIPLYAILSHMWGREEDEVLFKHIAGSDSDRREGEQRKGYAKIAAACKKAIEDGWKYIWIDTCCIDKESSAELSEAINSMYKWYHNSGVCYAYLEDVEGNEDLQNDESELNDEGVESEGGQLNEDLKGNRDATFEIVSFKRSRWFKRGWTLQELIAPQSLIFYGRDWVEIGTKGSLQDIVSVMTGIRVEMITGYDSKKASIAERMSWAAKRETERAEDIAYCLMGLFGVHMPLLYGEGPMAFIRLQEEIMKVSDDHSLFAWKVGIWEPDKTRGMLAGSPRDFRDTGNVVQGNEGAYSAYFMTNKGLQIGLPLQPIDPRVDRLRIDSGKYNNQNFFKATLNCTVGNKEPTRWITIYLERIKEGCYARKARHLGETYINPKDLEFIPLLITQVDTPTHTHRRYKDIKVIVLPTESGVTFGDRSLVGGCEYAPDDGEVLIFDHEGKYFGVVIGDDNGVVWLDVIEEIILPKAIEEINWETMSRIKL